MISLPVVIVMRKETESDDMLNSLNADGNQYIHDYLGFQNGYPILAWEMTLDDFQAGSISSLNSSVSEADYTAENWKQVQKILADAADRIHQAADMEAVDAIRTETQTALKAIETLAGAQERKLQEAKRKPFTCWKTMWIWKATGMRKRARFSL